MLVVGRPPFSMKNKEQLIKNIGTIPFLLKLCPEIQAFSPGFKDFIQGLLEIDQAKRLSAMQALSHPWIRQFLKTDLEVHTNFSSILKNIQRKSFIQKTMSIYINSFCTTQNSFETYKYFKAIDQDGNGMIDRRELEEELKLNHNDSEAKTIAAEFFKDYDLNQNHFIDYSEFATAVGCNQTVLNDENIEKVFNAVDKYRKGYVTVGDLQDFTGVDYNCLLDELNGSGRKENQMKLEEFKELLH
jgi:Ca2+-binding EF-hand superfamily protein